MKLVALVILLFSSSAYAQLRCVDKLLPAGRPSGAHQLTKPEWTPTVVGPLTVGEASKALSALVFSKLLCREGEIEFDRSPSCLALDETHPELITCAANSSLGHFVITTDTAQNANLIFHKLPRPPEETR